MGFGKGVGFASDSFGFVLVCFPEVSPLEASRPRWGGGGIPQRMLPIEDCLVQTKDLEVEAG